MPRRQSAGHKRDWKIELVRFTTVGYDEIKIEWNLVDTDATGRLGSRIFSDCMESDTSKVENWMNWEMGM